LIRAIARRIRISLALRKETSSRKEKKERAKLTLALARRTPHRKRASGPA